MQWRPRLPRAPSRQLWSQQSECPRAPVWACTVLDMQAGQKVVVRFGPTMTPSIVAVLAIGGLLGFRHAFEPDHLAAVSTLATRSGGRRLWSAARLGLIWGLGHTVTVGAVALLVLVLGVQLPAKLWPTAELVVAALLILLGMMVIWRYTRGRWHMHVHTHPAAGPHVHLHSHTSDSAHGHAHAVVDSRRSLG